VTNSSRRGDSQCVTTREVHFVFLTATLVLVVLFIRGSQMFTFVSGFSLETHGMTSASSAMAPLQWNHQLAIDFLKNRSHHGQSDDSSLSSCSSRQQQHELTGFWRTPTDLLEVQWKNSTILATNCSVRAIRFVVRGKPLPLKRHRTSSHKRHVYNPSAKPQAEFRQVVHEILTLCSSTSFDNNQPLFGSQELLVMKLVFHMNRPRNHFLRSYRNRNATKLRKGISPWVRVSKKVDVDNLAKFVLDSLNGILYDDDQQIFSLSATKVYDNSPSNDGATYLHLYSIPTENEEEISQFMQELLS
jgi:Holliday junction resolvase RusA-like endonuclease